MDHPDYYVWYLATTPEAAVGEVFGNLAAWDRSMFGFPAVPGADRALGVFGLPDDLRVLDLDDPAELPARGLRPTQIVARNLAVTQAWGHRIWSEADLHDPTRRRWQAVKWWSFHHPGWEIVASWERPRIEQVQDLHPRHPAVRDAATTLNRIL